MYLLYRNWMNNKATNNRSFQFSCSNFCCFSGGTLFDLVHTEYKHNRFYDSTPRTTCILTAHLKTLRTARDGTTHVQVQLVLPAEKKKRVRIFFFTHKLILTFSVFVHAFLVQRVLWSRVSNRIQQNQYDCSVFIFRTCEENMIFAKESQNGEIRPHARESKCDRDPFLRAIWTICFVQNKIAWDFQEKYVICAEKNGKNGIYCFQSFRPNIWLRCLVTTGSSSIRQNNVRTDDVLLAIYLCRSDQYSIIFFIEFLHTLVTFTPSTNAMACRSANSAHSFERS